MTNASKTQRALELVDAKIPVPEAARLAGIKTNGLYVALKRRERRVAGRCPCCGQLIKSAKK